MRKQWKVEGGRWKDAFFPLSTFHFQLSWVFLLLTGCAILGPIKRQVPSSTPQAAEFLDDSYEDFTGVIHVHTTYSHDAHGTFEDVVRVANAQGLDYVLLTEHNTLQPLRDGKQGWHGAVLVLIGVELSTRGGHLLAFNIREEISLRQPTQAIIDEVNRQGGLGFIAHPYFKKRRWTDWAVHGFTGVEGYNVVHDAFDENRLRLILWSMAVPADPLFLSILDRPYDPLAKWDELIRRHGKVVGIGSSDAHEIHLLGLKIAPYDIMFKLIRTHVLIPSTELTASAIYEALSQGHVYFSIDLVADATGFTFMADDAAQVLGIMGDEVELRPSLQLTAALPSPAELFLYKDGRNIATSIGSVWHVPVKEPGSYRLEVSRYGKPWIFSNPIYVRTPHKGASVSNQQSPPEADPPSAEADSAQLNAQQ